jgi:arylsulfatase A-like enzyme/tetratricopeptide (TPR) repeat protein
MENGGVRHRRNTVGAILSAMVVSSNDRLEMEPSGRDMGGGWRRRPAAAAAATVLAVVLCTSAAVAEIEETPPSIAAAPVILISIDTLRSDRLPAYGYDAVDTPAIDAMRGESVLFERAYSHSPMTLPAHVSMLTGTLPAAHGVRNNIGYTFDPDRNFFLPCFLGKKGYAVGAAVSTYVMRRESGFNACFDLYDDAVDPRAGDRTAHQERSGWVTLESSKRWIVAHHGQPFFFLFHIYEPHAPYQPPEPYRSRYRHPYDGEVAVSDAIVGEFIEFLRESGIWDRALVILTSDHGEGLGDHGEHQHSVLLNRELIQIPLLIKLPGGIRAGDAEGAPVQLVDLAPTIIDLLGFSTPSSFDGVPLFAAELASDRPVFSETLFPRIHLGWSDLASLVRGRYHYIEGPLPELYDVVADPAERKNLVTSLPKVASAIRELIEPFQIPPASLTDVDPETVRKLAALGYVGVPKRRTGPLPDPKERIHDLETIREALQLALIGKVVEAQATLRGLLRSNPSMVEGWARLGDVLDLAGEYAGAADAYRQALKVSPFATPDLMLNAAEAALRADRLDEAETLARSGIDGVPSRGHELLARVAMVRGEHAEAEREARAAVGEPPRPAGLVLLAETIQRQGRFREAMETLDRAEQLARETRVGPVFGLASVRGETLGKSGDLLGAKTAYRMEIEAYPSNLEAWAGLCVLYGLERDREEVYRLLEEMAAANPGPRAELLAADTLDAFGDTAGAARWRARAGR